MPLQWGYSFVCQSHQLDLQRRKESPVGNGHGCSLLEDDQLCVSTFASWSFFPQLDGVAVGWLVSLVWMCLECAC